MGLGTSLLLIALGAILYFAVTATVSGISIQAVGLILMVVGGVGLLITLFWMTRARDRDRDVVVRERGPRDRDYVVRERDVY